MLEGYLYCWAIICLSSLCSNWNTKIAWDISNQVCLISGTTLKEKVSSNKRSYRIISWGDKGRSLRLSSTQLTTGYSKERNLK